MGEISWGHLGQAQPGIRPGSTFFVTLRLADALAPESYLGWSRETNDRIQQETLKLHRPLTLSERERIIRRAHGKLEKLLDECQGICVLRTPEAAAAVKASLYSLESKLYLIHSWVVMPNHAHVVITLPVGQPVEPIAEHWKTSTAVVLTRLSGLMDPWHADVLCQTVAGPTRFRDFHDYIQKNPARAGLHGWLWVGGEGIPPINVIERWGDLSIDH